ncbi:helicase-exonuclease AddAB subunit AddA [Butyrivibrio sp. AE3004]|uniref:helicase-exonuclease AddAB subunit AddA n=1 Tax=Butyrivibrio sp. AE3004 TaxID=1506994 RepID=UPI000493CFBC|nr:helicase-exonuclease AddAB subunit AddA [Butyrivibrio sp. AE3004]
MGFTTEQQSVIDARNSNVLVSAAAGSGKTTVLVERIIQRITGDDPIDIDKLLVVTFTKAAAAQMKEKILAAIQKKLSEDPTNSHLQRQETLVHGAQITTIDSFCQYVIKNNFNDIDLDPSYRVGDEGEMRLLKADVLEELLENKYEEGDPEFLNCMEYFATGNSDRDVEDYILKLYNYAMSMPFPEEWLSERANDYFLNEASFEEAEFVKLSKKQIAAAIDECIQYFSKALALSNEPDGPYVYADMLEEEHDKLISIRNAAGKSFDEIRAEVLNMSFGTLSRKKDESINADKREAAKNYREKGKNQLKAIVDKYFAEDKKTICKHMEYAAKPVKTLAELAISFKEKFDEKKRDKGIIDFGDMEHLALDIILNGGAKQYRDYYEEVMIDEYQDSNKVQELLLSAISGEDEGIYNRFMVGDVKQSIYKFRLARPEIFMGKMKTYSWEEGADKRKISLHNNFRSRGEVLDGVNYVFEQIMGDDLGGVSYNEDARLVTGGEFPKPEEAQKDAFTTELMLADIKDSSSEEAKETEAGMIASRIAELMKTGIVTGEDKELRPVRYGDIVILLRTTKGWDDVFRKVLESKGIPAYVESRTGYFSATEVVTVLNFLRILNNPRQDVPLVSVMHSAIGGFSDEELALIKSFDRMREKDAEKNLFDDDSFYDILLKYTGDWDNRNGDSEKAEDTSAEADILSEKLAKKISDFLAFIHEYRKKAEYLPVNELIRHILNDTHYGEYCAALPGGAKRLANLNMLCEKASDYERTSFSGVFHFVRYIEQLEKYEVDYGEANILDENADVVRIMSIHKSKGLEFPIVFLSGMSKSFNYRDTMQSVVLDMDMGMGANALDLEHRIKYRTLRKSVMSDVMKSDILGEEMRILYVAMTRAKDKLIMTGQTKIGDGEKIADSELGGQLQKYMSFRNRQPEDTEQPYLLPYYLRNSAGSYQDLVLMALARHSEFEAICKGAGIDCEPVKATDKETGNEPPFAFRLMSADELTAKEITEEVSAKVRLQKLTLDISPEEQQYVQLFEDRFSHSYAFSNYEDLYVKTTVTELKKAQLESENEPAYQLIPEEEIVPEFISDKEKKAVGAARGTIYHRIMELLYGTGDDSIDDITADLSGWIKHMEEKGKVPAGAFESVKTEDFLKFYKSEIGGRMKQAMLKGKLFRESPFMMGISANLVNPKFPESEQVLIQGIIDVWFEEDDGIVLLDYKTDKVRRAEELVEKYKVQLDYYQQALERIVQKKVKERVIYSFTLGETILL